MDPSFSDDLALLRQKWSQQLTLSLKEAYGGRMPSLSTVSRDLALRSSYLPQVSNETVRKWIRGDSIPSAIAILALANWLGDEILLPLSATQGIGFKGDTSNLGYSDSCADLADTVGLDQLVSTFQRLGPREQALVFSLVQALSKPKDIF